MKIEVGKVYRKLFYDADTISDNDVWTLCMVSEVEGNEVGGCYFIGPNSNVNYHTGGRWEGRTWVLMDNQAHWKNCFEYEKYSEPSTKLHLEDIEVGKIYKVTHTTDRWAYILVNEITHSRVNAYYIAYDSTGCRAGGNYPRADIPEKFSVVDDQEKWLKVFANDGYTVDIPEETPVTEFEKGVVYSDKDSAVVTTILFDSMSGDNTCGDYLLTVTGYSPSKTFYRGGQWIASKQFYKEDNQEKWLSLFDERAKNAQSKEKLDKFKVGEVYIHSNQTVIRINRKWSESDRDYIEGPTYSNLDGVNTAVAGSKTYHSDMPDQGDWGLSSNQDRHKANFEAGKILTRDHTSRVEAGIPDCTLTNCTMVDGSFPDITKNLVDKSESSCKITFRGYTGGIDLDASKVTTATSATTRTTQPEPPTDNLSDKSDDEVKEVLLEKLGRSTFGRSNNPSSKGTNMSESTKFLDRDGVIPVGLRASIKHAKWTGSSILNMVINTVGLAVVLAFIYPQMNPVTFQQDIGEYVSYDTTKKVVALDNGQEQLLFQAVGDNTWINCQTFEDCSNQMNNQLNKILMTRDFYSDSPDDARYKRVVTSSFLPHLK